MLLLLGAVAHAAGALNIYFIDVEGGQSTLVVSPSRQSLPIDAGYAGFGGRDAKRIDTAAKAAGVSRIDYLLVTHFHSDHVGGVLELLERLPVSNILDYGPSVDAGGKYPDDYAAAVASSPWQKSRQAECMSHRACKLLMWRGGTGGFACRSGCAGLLPQAARIAHHTVAAPGNKIPVKGLVVTVVAAAGKTIQRPGVSNPYCSGVAPHKEGEGDETGENPQAVGVVIELGKFLFGDFSESASRRTLIGLKM